MLFKADSDKSEVLGNNILTYISGMGAFEGIGRQILKDYGFEVNVSPEKWYNHQHFLDVVEEIAKQTGPHTITLIGMRISERLKLPPEINNVEKAFQWIDDAYRINHRGDIHSHKKFINSGEKTGYVICETPYPCELDTGYLKGLINRLASGSEIEVLHVSTEPCRKNGANSCTYYVKW